MAQKAITIYTPADAAAHIYAEDDAQVHRALLGGSGITLADDQLACTVVNANQVTLGSGVYSNQGYLLCVQGGTVAALSVASGTPGAYRHDLIVADFTRGGGTVADSHVFAVVQGTDAASESAAEDPALTQDDLTQGGSRRQEAVWRLLISGSGITAVERVAPYIGSVYQ